MFYIAAISIFVLTGSFGLPALLIGIILVTVYGLYLASVIHQDKLSKRLKEIQRAEHALAGSRLLQSSVILKESVTA